MARDAAYWVAQLGGDDEDRAEAELKQLGAKAVPALIGLLSHRELGYRAAMFLGEIGAPGASAAVPALENAAKSTRNHFTQMWSTTALAQLGELELVMSFAKQARMLPAVVSAFKEARPTSYAFYELLLAKKDRKVAAMIASELSPGNAMYDPIAPDFDAIAAATKSRSAALRKDAAIALGSFKQVSIRKRCVPVLVELLADKDAEVRRLAVMSLADCKAAARPVLPQIRALLRDANAKVRMWAKDAIEKVAQKAR